ncbi:MAG: IclR family transcriptional regulator [Rhizobiaceae bacterium MnEN-MB40S]|nr:MAG: IclR family transcriptional regulator [Rhizobiaceae bacterium MnEN-MB40S]
MSEPRFKDVDNVLRHPAGSGDVKSALRVINVLDLLGRWGGARTHVQISEELNIPKSSLTQVLRTLTRHGYLSFDQETRGYSLGPAIEDLGARSRTTRKLSEVVAPVLEWLTEFTGESSALNFREGDDHRVVATVLGPHRIVAHLRLNDRAPLHATSGGQVILAHLSQTLREEYLSRARFESYAKNSLLSAEDVRSKLDRIREDGFAKVVEEFTPGIGGIALPIFDSRQRPLASLSVTVPVGRFTDDLSSKSLAALGKAIASLRHRAELS